MTHSRYFAAALALLIASCSASSTEESNSGAAGTTAAAAGTSSGGAAGATQAQSGGNAGTVASGGNTTGGGGSTAGNAGAASGGTLNAAGGGAGGEVANTAGAAGNASQLDAVQPSMGCTLNPDIAPGNYEQSTVDGRSVWVRLPDNYDPTRAYPLIFVWKGCGGAGALSILHMESVAGADAILVHGDVAAGMDCYDTADAATFVDLPFFDAFLTHLTTNYCVDEAHVFSAGFSSGAWLSFLLGCQRASVLRAIGTIAGGFKPPFYLGQPECVGHTAAFMISDLADTNNPFHDLDTDGDSVEIGLNQWLTFNGCTETTWTEAAGTPASPDTAVCRSYAGCGDHPVELCLTDGMGHSDQTSLSVPGFWEFFSQFLPATSP